MIATDSVNTSSLTDDLVPKYLLDVASQINETITKVRTYFNDPVDAIGFSTLNSDTQYQPLGVVEQAQSSLEATSRKRELPIQVQKEIRSIISIGYNTAFEDGIDNDFYNSLDEAIRRYGINVLDTLQEQIAFSHMNPEVSAAILQYLGEMKHIQSYRLRLQVLIYELQHRSATVRDGAALGLASLDDPLAIPALKAAIRREKIADLREDMQLVLEQLEEMN